MNSGTLHRPDSDRTVNLTTAPHPRSRIHYWKCDRPAAFHGTGEKREHAALEPQLLEALRPHTMGRQVSLHPFGGQGNHLTWVLYVDARRLFVRVEDGPEQDDYLEVESRVLAEVRFLGVPSPKVHMVDASRQLVPFAWHVMDCVDCPDLNHLHKEGRLDLLRSAWDIGISVAKWQGMRPRGFGPFSPEILREQDELEGFHAKYADYFQMNLEKHLTYLADEFFLTGTEAEEILAEVQNHAALLDLKQGCLVHKDLALWNVLGTENFIHAFIDWDDAISGDAMDDLSLLGCFHDAAVIKSALTGYTTVRALPPEYRRRFWLHLLRNMIVKSVIRVGAGYFNRTDGFFLIGSGSTGAELREFTRKRLFGALQGLREDLDISHLQ